MEVKCNCPINWTLGVNGKIGTTSKDVLYYLYNQFSYINVLFLNQYEDYFGTDIVILNRGQTTRSTPEMASPLQPSAPHQEDVSPPTYDLGCNRSTTRWIFSGIGFRTWSVLPLNPEAYH
ncbi:hypothetical protein AVEN_157228-1 [Araneus ventricosus]|uniref:Uncharacterized protein n=1 Tax=Araneus ventricosus TaxID=182803 RepID=A0A4Y2VBY9_ARAVE|nr:hypothetical protein AVEN_157228-1 [Araneus ventricosus]